MSDSLDEADALGGIEEQRDDVTSRTLSAMLWMFSGDGVKTVVRMIVLMILARLLAPAAFGLVSAAMLVVKFSEMLSMIGVGPALIQRADLEKRHVRTAFTISIFFGVGLAAIFIFGAPYIAQFFRLEGLVPVLYAFSLRFPLSTTMTIPDCLLQRDLRFDQIAQINVISSVSSSAVAVVAALAGAGVWALVAQSLFMSAVRAVLMFTRQPHAKRPMLDGSATKDLLSFGGGDTLGSMLNFSARKGDYLLVGRLMDASALGIYSRAYGLMNQANSVIGTVLNRVMFSSLSSVQDDPERLGRAYRRGVALLALLVLPLSVFMIVMAPEVIYAALGPQWSEAVVPFQILTVGMFFRASGKVSGPVPKARGRVYRMAWRKGVYAACVFAGVYAGIQYGLPGVAVGVLGAIAVIALLLAQLALSQTTLGAWELLAVHSPAALLSCVAGGLAWGLAVPLRGAGFSPFLVLFVCGAAVSVVILSLVLWVPSYTIGRDGIWLIEKLLDYLPTRFPMVRRFKAKVQQRLAVAS